MNTKEFNPGFKPKGKRVLVYPLPTERVTEGGIILHDTASDREDMKQIEVLVLEVGAGCWTDQRDRTCKHHTNEFGYAETNWELQIAQPWCGPGDKVLIAAYAGLYRKGKDGKHYRIISDLDVVAVVED